MERDKIIRYLAAPLLALLFAGALFFFLKETPMVWRIILSALIFISSFIMADGFLGVG